MPELSKRWYATLQNRLINTLFSNMSVFPFFLCSSLIQFAGRAQTIFRKTYCHIRVPANCIQATQFALRKTNKKEILNKRIFTPIQPKLIYIPEGFVLKKMKKTLHDLLYGYKSWQYFRTSGTSTIYLKNPSQHSPLLGIGAMKKRARDLPLCSQELYQLT